MMIPPTKLKRVCYGANAYDVDVGKHSSCLCFLAGAKLTRHMKIKVKQQFILIKKL